MDKNVIAIDPSLNSTAMVVNDIKFIYAKADYGMSEKTGKLKKWFELCDHLITYRWITYKKIADHSEQEILKLVQYDELTDRIIQDILDNIDPNLPTIAGIEGYSYSSSAGPLIDLVTFSTFIRSKLYNKVTENIVVYQPAHLKLEAAKLTYAPTVKGVKVKKYEFRNNQGISGGKFKKPEMYRALIDNTNINCLWVKFLRQNAKDIIDLNTVPKPIEDMNDAKLMYEIILKNK
jgi:hypothetical protein